MRIKRLVTLAALLGGLSAGCGPTSQTAGKPTDEQIKADQEAQKRIEQEERGKPIKGKKN